MSDDGFLKRWSRRKSLQTAQIADGPAQTPPASAMRQPLPSATPPAHTTAAVAAPANALAPQPLTSPADGPPQTEGPAPTALSLADTQSLTPESDFRPFMGQGVAPEVKNAAMKKLFADPHFNVMDRMDVYIDDYSQPDPIPQAMLRQLASAKFLNLFEEDEDAKKEAHAAVSDIPQANGSQVVAQSDPVPPISNSQSSKHDHPDLRLQPDPATRPESAGPKPV